MTANSPALYLGFREPPSPPSCHLTWGQVFPLESDLIWASLPFPGNSSSFNCLSFPKEDKDKTFGNTTKRTSCEGLEPILQRRTNSGGGLAKEHHPLTHPSGNNLCLGNLPAVMALLTSLTLEEKTFKPSGPWALLRDLIGQSHTCTTTPLPKVWSQGVCFSPLLSSSQLIPMDGAGGTYWSEREQPPCGLTVYLRKWQTADTARYKHIFPNPPKFFRALG